MEAMPAGFLWGTATSAHQIEGWNRHNDWWDFEPRFSLAACDFVRRFETDLDLARALGTNTFRLSLEWSRVEPRPGERDADAVAFYDRVFAACRERGLRPLVTLVHFTLPRWCASRGGWLDPETLAAFERHVEWVAERFGDTVDLFCTINEPNVHAGASYISGIFPPGRRFRPDLAARCEAALVRAHVRAYRILHEVIDRKHPGQRLQVGPAQHAIAWRPSRLDVLGLVRRGSERFNWGFLDAIEDDPDTRGTFDFVGINYYMALESHLMSALRFGGVLKLPRSPGTSDLGWPIEAAGLTTILVEAARRYGRPVIVTENGIADSRDLLRPGFLTEHVHALERARAQGADVVGYYHWSLIDNFEWHEGFGPRFGLHAIDYETQERTARPSAAVYRAIIAGRSG